jgi:hypothetical protein
MGDDKLPSSQSMKTATPFRIVLLAIFSAILAACATYPHSGPMALAGKWTNRLGTVWTIKDDATFEVDLNHDGKRDAWGRLAVEGDKVTIIGTEGVVPKGCEGNGVYRFTRDRDTLHFTLVSDKCALRVKNVMLAWHRQ